MAVTLEPGRWVRMAVTPDGSPEPIPEALRSSSPPQLNLIFSLRNRFIEKYKALTIKTRVSFHVGHCSCFGFSASVRWISSPRSKTPPHCAWNAAFYMMNGTVAFPVRNDAQGQIRPPGTVRRGLLDHAWLPFMCSWRSCLIGSRSPGSLAPASGHAV